MHPRQQTNAISWPKPASSAPFTPTSTIYRQLRDQWHGLDPSIQNRFRHDPELGEPVVYTGVMQTITRSRAGWLFARLSRVIGNPLTPHAGANVRVEVMLFRKPEVSGVFWRRKYSYPGRKPCIVTSVKRESARGEMMECVGGGFGMLLELSVAETRLHFTSTRYFWQRGPVRIALPHWLSPGKTHVVHEDPGVGEFRFSIVMDHNLLGRTFFQQRTFREKMLED